jgi:hypothetical protein
MLPVCLRRLKLLTVSAAGRSRVELEDEHRLNLDDRSFHLLVEAARATTKYASYQLPRIQCPQFQYKSGDQGLARTSRLPASLTDIPLQKTHPKKAQYDS